MVMSPNNKIMSLNSSVHCDLSLWWGHLCVMGSMLSGKLEASGVSIVSFLLLLSLARKRPLTLSVYPGA